MPLKTEFVCLLIAPLPRKFICLLNASPPPPLPPPHKKCFKLYQMNGATSKNLVVIKSALCKYNPTYEIKLLYIKELFLGAKLKFS